MRKFVKDNSIDSFLVTFSSIFKNWMVSTGFTQVQPRCLRCSSTMYLVSQVYCPLLNSDYHRTIYVFGCGSKTCWNQPNSYTVVRCQQRKKAKEQVVQTIVENDDWGTNEWFEDVIDEVKDISKHDISSEEGDVCSIVDKFKNSFKLSECCSSSPSFTPYFIFVIKEEEIANQVGKNDHEIQLYNNYIQDVQNSLTKSGKNDFDSNETYEKTRLIHGDRAFHNFSKKVRRCPEQCLRYEWNGNPLLLSSHSDVTPDIKSVPNCDQCGSQRVFEMQLVPRLASYLHYNNPAQSDSDADTCCSLLKDSQAGLDIDFGCIYIYTCSSSCWKDNVDVALIEVAAVHPDPETLKLMTLKTE